MGGGGVKMESVGFKGQSLRGGWGGAWHGGRGKLVKQQVGVEGG